VRRFCCIEGDGSMVSASDGDSFVVRRMATASWCIGWRRLCGASNGDGFVVRRMSTASWCVGWRRLCGASEKRPMRLKRPLPAGKADEADGARLMRPMMLKRPSPAGKADEAEEAVTGVTIE
jgi:hypothetical protein